MKHFVVAAREQEVPRGQAARPTIAGGAARPRPQAARRDVVPGAGRARRRRADVRDRAGRADRAREGEPGRGARDIDLFERWAAVHRFVPAAHAGVAGWVSFHFPHFVDHEDLVPLRRPDAKLPDDHRRAARAPAAARRLRADRPAHVAARGRERGRLLPLLPRAREGLVLDRHARQAGRGEAATRWASSSAAARWTRRSARCTSCARTAIRSAALAMIVVDNPMLPGTGHRICNDCMKGCVFQKQEPVNIPQAETGRADRRARDALGLRDLRPAHALEPAEPRAARSRCRTSARTCWSSGSGPAGYTLAHHLAQRRLRRGRHRRPQDRAAAGGSDRRATPGRRARSRAGTS